MSKIFYTKKQSPSSKVVLNTHKTEEVNSGNEPIVIFRKQNGITYFVRKYDADFVAFFMENQNPVGWGCGYIAVPNTHPWYGKDYDDIEGVNVHGGLTFSNKVSSLQLGEIIKEDLWVLGFDTGHYTRNASRLTKDFVLRETKELYEQALTASEKFLCQ